MRPEWKPEPPVRLGGGITGVALVGVADWVSDVPVACPEVDGGRCWVGFEGDAGPD